jgi:peptidyl-prolyl cis-trans isomerase C
MKIGKMGLLSILAIALAGGCTTEQTSDPSGSAVPAVATIDGAPVARSLFEFYANARLQKDAEDLTDDEFDSLLEELIQFQLLTTAADEQGVTEEPEVAAQLEMQRQQTLARLMATRHLTANPITDTELSDAYDENLPRLSGPQFKARHILVAEESESRAIIEELQGGADFQELARTRSTGPSGPNGGDLGWFAADTMVPPFADAVRAMEVGSFSSEPVQTRFGWHVILLEDSAEQQAPSLESVRADLTNAVEQGKIESYVNSLRDAAVITRTE